MNKCWESNTLTEKEVENANVATHNFNSSAPLSSSYFYTLVTPANHLSVN